MRLKGSTIFLQQWRWHYYSARHCISLISRVVCYLRRSHATIPRLSPVVASMREPLKRFLIPVLMFWCCVAHAQPMLKQTIYFEPNQVTIKDVSKLNNFRDSIKNLQSITIEIEGNAAWRTGYDRCSKIWKWKSFPFNTRDQDRAKDIYSRIQRIIPGRAQGPAPPAWPIAVAVRNAYGYPKHAILNYNQQWPIDIQGSIILAYAPGSADCRPRQFVPEKAAFIRILREIEIFFAGLCGNF